MIWEYIVKITYMSDIHLEFGILDISKIECGDILILAGDISIHEEITREVELQWFAELKKKFLHILYIAGNHEFYGGDILETRDKIDQHLVDCRFIHLQDKSITFDNITFHGATLWTNFNMGNPLNMIEAKYGMNDFMLISSDNYSKKLTPEYVYEEHKKSMAILEENVKEGDVIFTHHAPSFNSISVKYKNDKLTSAFASDYSRFIIDKKPSFWIHGHVHHNNDYKIGQTNILSNPRGYVNEKNEKFDINKHFIL